MDGLSVSYGEREIEFMNPSSHVTEDQEGVALAYQWDLRRLLFSKMKH